MTKNWLQNLKVGIEACERQNQVVPLLFYLILEEVDPDVLLLILVRELQVDQRLFAWVWDEGHLFEFDHSMVFQVADALEFSVIYVGPSTRLVAVSSTAKSKRRAICFFLRIRLRPWSVAHILDLVQTDLVFSDHNSILKQSYVLLLVSIGIPNASTTF